ncbi:hypothetical protein cypCar_00013694 [Cyprinus carpio]|nr:hypothetical protein cypCar_00013694 [Cyprinus carpio]
MSLVQLGADVNAKKEQCSGRRTPICLWTCKNCDLGATLIALGADVNSLTYEDTHRTHLTFADRTAEHPRRQLYTRGAQSFRAMPESEIRARKR